MHVLGQTWTVKNCNDSGPDSLRDIIENPVNAQSGDTVDLSELPVRCGMTNSVITLGSEIKIQQDDLYLHGPTEGTVTVSGAGTSRVFHHYGSGTLLIEALRVSDGYYHSMGGDAQGGCVYSYKGRLFLSHVVVSECAVVSDGSWARGGGISARAKDVTLLASRVSGNHAKDIIGSGSEGGGVYSRTTTFAWYSTISANDVYDGNGGGVAARAGATLIGSTIENNLGRNGAGIAVDGGPTTILNSTISGNSASNVAGGLLELYASLIANSTIAFNHASDNAGGVHFHGSPPADGLTLQSSIIANNTAGPSSTPDDVFVDPGFGSLAGTDNLVMASNISDPAVIVATADPKLGPLQFNGGRTRTHMLLPGSPALGIGNVAGLPPAITSEQRGAGYPRTTGPSASVDLGAVQFDSIFADAFDAFFLATP